MVTVAERETGDEKGSSGCTPDRAQRGERESEDRSGDAAGGSSRRERERERRGVLVCICMGTCPVARCGFSRDVWGSGLLLARNPPARPSAVAAVWGLRCRVWVRLAWGDRMAYAVRYRHLLCARRRRRRAAAAAACAAAAAACSGAVRDAFASQPASTAASSADVVRLRWPAQRSAVVKQLDVDCLVIRRSIQRDRP